MVTNKMGDINDIKTGDLLLFSRKSFKSNITRFFTASRWNHIGIAVRIPGDPSERDSFDPEKVDLKFHMTEGKLYILELVDRSLSCFRCIPYDLQLRHYRCIAYRPLKEEYRPLVKKNLADFYRKYYNAEYMSVMDQINMLLGSPFSSKGRDRGYSCTMIANKFMTDVFSAPKTLYTLPGSYDSTECDPTTTITNSYYLREVIVHIDREGWWTVIGFLLVWLIVYLLFWYFTSSYFF